MNSYDSQLSFWAGSPGPGRLLAKKGPRFPDSLAKIADPLALNPQQLHVVTAAPGPHLVIAGAGSGKTNVLVRRAAWYIAQGIPPKKILCITFTRKAAHEMLERVQELNPLPTQRLEGGTFHSKAHHWLRLFGSAIGLSARFTLMDEADSTGMLHLLASKQRLTNLKGFPDKRAILTMFGHAANSLTSIAETIETTFPQYAPHLSALVSLHRLFRDTKWTQQRFDYDDLLLLVHRLLMEQPETALQLCSLYQAVLVDEYQDSTRLQAELVRLLSAHHHNVFVVGDDAQSIYRFRSADVRNMHEFPHLFPDVTTFKLEQNYRSTGSILRLANAVLSAAPNLYRKELHTTNAEGCRPQLVQCPDEHVQSEYVIDRIRFLQQQGLGLHRIAVLFRLSAHSYDLETALTRYRIPFMKYGGLALVETDHVKDFLAYLTVAVRPTDRLSWQRLLLLLDRLTPAGVEEVIARIKRAASALDPLDTDTSGAAGELRALAQVIRQLKDPAIPFGLRLQGVLDHYQGHLHRHYPEDMHERAAELAYLIKTHAVTESLDALLDSVTGTGRSNHTQTPSHPDDTLVLSTIHSAKGLEWDAVFLLNAVDGQLPHSRSLKDAAALEEERRLLYVAVTRPRHLLTISYPLAPGAAFGTPAAGKCSRFLEGIDADILERIVLT